jgi:hypothetical protein
MVSSSRTSTRPSSEKVRRKEWGYRGELCLALIPLNSFGYHSFLNNFFSKIVQIIKGFREWRRYCGLSGQNLLSKAHKARGKSWLLKGDTTVPPATVHKVENAARQDLYMGLTSGRSGFLKREIKLLESLLKRFHISDLILLCLRAILPMHPRLQPKQFRHDHSAKLQVKPKARVYR